MRPKTSGVERVNLPAIAKVSAASPSVPVIAKGVARTRARCRLREAIQCEGGKADCFVATLVALTAKC